MQSKHMHNKNSQTLNIQVKEEKYCKFGFYGNQIYLPHKSSFNDCNLFTRYSYIDFLNYFGLITWPKLISQFKVNMLIDFVKYIAYLLPIGINT